MSRANLSVLWEFFTKNDVLEKKAKCNICGEIYSYKSSTANLKIHLKRKHLSAYEQVSTAQLNLRAPIQLNQVPHTVNIAADQSVQPCTSSSLPGSSTLLSTFHRSSQQRIERYGTAKKNSLDTKRKIDNDLIELFIDSYHPFSLVEERAFKKFARWIPGYQLPSRKTVSNILIPNLYNKTTEIIKKEISDIENVCLTTDLWTSRVNDAYLAITGHYIDKKFQMKMVLLKCAVLTGPHSSANIQNSLLETTEEWNVTKNVNFVVSDNAPNIKKAIKDLGWKHYGCYGHTLNLIVQDSLQIVQTSLDKVKCIVRHFKTSTIALEKLLKTQTQDKPDLIPKRLIQDVPTRWNSTYHMIERFVELESYIRATVAVLKKDLPIISNEEWTVIAELCKVLKPFDEATKAMSGENYITASSIIVMTRCLKGSCDQLKIENFTDITKTVISVLHSGLETRFEGVERSGTFSICTFLDPRYKNNVFLDPQEASRIKKKVEEMIAANINRRSYYDQPSVAPTADPVTKDKFSPWAILESLIGKQQQTGTPLSRAIREVDSYINDEFLPVFDDNGKFNSPLAWWGSNRHLYPNLAVLVKQYGNIVATSVPCERIFSKAGLMINERRTRLKTNKVTQLTYLNSNLDPNRFNE